MDLDLRVSEVLGARFGGGGATREQPISGITVLVCDFYRTIIIKDEYSSMCSL